MYAKLHELPKAILAFNSAIEHNPKFAGAYENRGRAHYNLGNYEKALEDFSKVIDLTPGSQEAFYNRSNTLLKLQRYNEAQQDLERAVDLDPNDTAALLVLAETAIFTRSIERVLSIAERVLSLSDEPRDRMLSSYFECLALHDVVCLRGYASRGPATELLDP